MALRLHIRISGRLRFAFLLIAVAVLGIAILLAAFYGPQDGVEGAVVVGLGWLVAFVSRLSKGGCALGAGLAASVGITLLVFVAVSPGYAYVLGRAPHFTMVVWLSVVGFLILSEASDIRFLPWFPSADGTLAPKLRFLGFWLLVSGIFLALLGTIVAPYCCRPSTFPFVPTLSLRGFQTDIGQTSLVVGGLGWTLVALVPILRARAWIGVGILGGFAILFIPVVFNVFTQPVEGSPYLVGQSLAAVGFGLSALGALLWIRMREMGPNTVLPAAPSAAT